VTEIVRVPMDLLLDLWRYGNLAPVDGVMYGRSHRDRLAEADRIIAKAYEDAERSKGKCMNGCDIDACICDFA
jgi:hypothetical protein